MTDDEEYAARSQLKWRRDGDGKHKQKQQSVTVTALLATGFAT
jgi:hypothetical protein